MSNRPNYFDEIQGKAAQRWDQLEQDPELAGPWHQLFKQVQSPRHVLSELLQNADDAGATEATVSIENGEFVFSHNGEDFTADHFASLCRFGYSNKRSMHTIGFRGIGFKSTFSIGPEVRLFTPTLSVVFHKKRFTQPNWIAAHKNGEPLTKVCVSFEDEYRQQELEKNLDEWIKSPASLLFFRSIRTLRVKEHEVRWQTLEAGPVERSEWIALSSSPDKRYLLISSPEVELPPEVVDEIKEERLISGEEDAAFPPCRVEIVVGMEGRLFVILPTGVKTQLPFACNAPFIQDPDRKAIKDPSISPTNRWLLKRIGELAASSMLIWLQRTDLDLEARSAAYDLLPNVNRNDDTLDGKCGTLVQETLSEAIQGKLVLLTHEGKLVQKQECVIFPDGIGQVWSTKETTELLDPKCRPALAESISRSNRTKLQNWRLVDRLAKEVAIRVLQEKSIPKPGTWEKLLILWSFVDSDIQDLKLYPGHQLSSNLQIFPVQGQNTLFSAKQVIRLSEKRLLNSDEDWQFLAVHVLVIDQKWIDYLNRRLANEAGKDSQWIFPATYAFDTLRKLKFDESSNANEIAGKVINAFFAQLSPSLTDCVRLTQIFAKLGADVGEHFQYYTKSGKLTRSNGNILVDKNGELETLLPASYLDQHLLHPSYTENFVSCSLPEWGKWVQSGKAHLSRCPSLIKMGKTFKKRNQFEGFVKSINPNWDPEYPYSYSWSSWRNKYPNQKYFTEDFDLPEEIIMQWNLNLEFEFHEWYPEQAFVVLLMEMGPSYWQDKTETVMHQTSTNGSGQKRVRSNIAIPAAWLRRLQKAKCLPDTRGSYREPNELLRRTPQTEALLDVEPFIDAKLDTEANRPLWDLLGVRSVPGGPKRLLDRLKALSRAENPPVSELDKYYRGLDKLIESDLSHSREVKTVFQSERLIFTQEGTWEKLSAVFQHADEENIPGMATVRASVADLKLWSRVGVEERPNKESAIRWLKDLPKGRVLSPEDIRRVKLWIKRFPVEIWTHCSCWLNLSGAWTSTQRLKYSLTLQSLTAWSHLHATVKDQTANLQDLPASITALSPFSDLLPLASSLEERLTSNIEIIDQPRVEWITALGQELYRVDLKDVEHNAQLRKLAQDLACTTWYTVSSLETIPYLNGTPAGTPRTADVVWTAQKLYVCNPSKAKQAKLVPDEIGKAFDRPDIKAAIHYCFNRGPEEIREYIRENFDLRLEDSAPVQDTTEHRNLSLPTGEPRKYADPITTDSNGHQEQIPASGTTTTVTGGTGNGEPTTVTPPPPPPVKQKVPFIEIFVMSKDFKKISDTLYLHPDGTRIQHSQDNRSMWEMINASGNVVRTYLPKEHNLKRSPLPIDAAQWGIIQSFPERYALVLVDENENPVEVPGTTLLALRDDGRIRLHPASYRIEYIDDSSS